jgi:hypothetical protein
MIQNTVNTIIKPITGFFLIFSNPPPSQKKKILDRTLSSAPGYRYGCLRYRTRMINDFSQTGPNLIVRSLPTSTYSVTPNVRVPLKWSTIVCAHYSTCALFAFRDRFICIVLFAVQLIIILLNWSRTRTTLFCRFIF